jgi:hypothetical protein
LYLWLRAARDVTYADGHHELEQINAQIFHPNIEKPDQIVADRAMYDQKTGMLQCNGNVQIESRCFKGEDGFAEIQPGHESWRDVRVSLFRA